MAVGLEVWNILAMQPMMLVPPLLTVRTSVWLRLFRENRIAWWAVPRAIVIVGFSVLFGVFRAINRRTFVSGAIAKPLERPPLFVLGHWRSGTTLLQTYLSRDPQMGILDGFQAFLTGLERFDGPWLRWMLGAGLAAKRQQDQMPRGLQIPEEEEFALGNLSVESAYHSFWFPRCNEYFERSVLFPTLADRERWKQIYSELVLRVAALTGKPQLCLKSPPNTARVGALLELYPDAKFVHIHRHPYAVYASMRNMLKVAVQPYALQEFSEEEQEERTFSWYRVVMRRYLLERDRIPPENLVEIAFEEFEQEPLEGLRAIYDRLGIPGLEQALPQFEAYRLSTQSYAKNTFGLDERTKARIRREWAFAFDAWNYPE